MPILHHLHPWDTVDWSPLQLVPLFLIRLFGKPATVCGLTALGGLSLAAGVYGWLRNRLNKPGE
jgi:hypothetical protein